MSLHRSASPSLNLAVELRRAVVKSRVELSTMFSWAFERSGGGLGLDFQLFMHAHRLRASASA
jgi:hypothetical protein